MPITYYTQNKLIDHLTAHAAYSAPANLYGGLFYVAPTRSGGGTEFSTTVSLPNTAAGYARAIFTWAAAISGRAADTTAINFPYNVDVTVAAAASANWPRCVALGIFDALTVGNLIGYHRLTTPRTIVTGDHLHFNAADIALAFI